MSSNKTKDQLAQENEELRAEIEALKITDATADTTQVVRLPEDKRTFSVEISDPDGKKSRTVKCLLKDVAKIYIAGQKHTQEQFMADKDLQVKAAQIKHPLIKFL